MTPTVTDVAVMVAAQAETPQASTAFSTWLNNAIQQHSEQTAERGVEVDADINIGTDSDTGIAAEDELLVIIEQLNGMMSGNQANYWLNVVVVDEFGGCLGTDVVDLNCICCWG